MWNDVRKAMELSTLPASRCGDVTDKLATVYRQYLRRFESRLPSALAVAGDTVVTIRPHTLPRTSSNRAALAAMGAIEEEDEEEQQEAGRLSGKHATKPSSKRAMPGVDHVLERKGEDAS